MHRPCNVRAENHGKITDVKELSENRTLITTEDSAGIEFSFIEMDFAQHKTEFSAGQKGIYQIKADLESVKVPRNSLDGVTLEGKDAKKFFDWVAMNWKRMLQQPLNSLLSRCIKMQGFFKDGSLQVLRHCALCDVSVSFRRN